MSPAILVTSVVAAAVTLALIGADIVWATDHVRGNTLSEVIRYWGERYKLIAFAWGGLGMHFFHGASWWALPRQHGIPALLWCTCVAEVLALATPLSSWAYFVMGAVVWAICWPV
jgi:hypothetical protein